MRPVDVSLTPPLRNDHAAVACFAGSAASLPPFLANFRGGLPARIDGNVSLQVPRDLGYRWHQSTVADLVTVTVYNPALLHLDVLLPDDDQVEFLLLPSLSWLARARARVPGSCDTDSLASLFCAYLDRRCRLPLLADPRFHRSLFELATSQGWLRPALESYQAPLPAFDQLRLARPLACSIAQRDLEQVLATHIAQWRTTGDC